MNYKRRKSRRSVRCTLCTPNRWRGNGKGRFKERVEARIAATRTQACAETPVSTTSAPPHPA